MSRKIMLRKMMPISTRKILVTMRILEMQMSRVLLLIYMFLELGIFLTINQEIFSLKKDL